MNNVVIRLQNRNQKEIISDPIQVDIKSNKGILTALTNTLIGKEADYIFFYKESRLTEDLEGILKNADLEETLVIEYMDENEMKSDLEVTCKDTVVDLLFDGTHLYYLLYDGTLLSLNDELKCNIKNIKGVFKNRRVYCFTTFSIFEVTTEENLFTIQEQIRSAISFSYDNKEFVAIAIDNGIHIYDCIDHSSIFISDLNRPRNLMFDGACLCWIEGFNIFIKYDYKSKEMTSKKLKGIVNDFCTDGIYHYFSTSDNVILKLVDDRIEERFIEERMSKFISYDKEYQTLVISGQHSILILNPENLEEIKYYVIQDQVNCISVGDMIYVGSGCKILGFK